MEPKTPSRVSVYKERYNNLVAEKKPWLPMYQLIGEYVLTRKQNFLVSSLPGAFLTEQLYSSVAPNANQIMASSLIGNMWPNGARSIRLERPRNITDNKENKDYYDQITNTFIDILDAPETGVATMLQEYMLDQGAFGISGALWKRTGDLTDPLRTNALNVKYFLIDENKEGFIDTIFLEHEWTARQIVEEYGFENVSSRIKEAYNERKIQDKFKVVHVIEPRPGAPRVPKRNTEYPITSFHFEHASGKILRDSGYLTMPAVISRMLKALGEKQGRSPAMFAIPAIMRLNAVWELLMRAGEKKLTPPLWMYDNGGLGPDVIDFSPQAVNIFEPSGLGEKSPIGALFDVGNLQDIFPIAETLVNDVTQAFYIDRLLDLNNEARQTLGEAQIRDRLRGEALSSVFRRQSDEFFSPWLRTAFNMLLEDGILGVVPGSPNEERVIKAGLEPIYIPNEIADAMQRGQKVYNIKYISPAARIMKTEELQGLTRALDIGLGVVPAMPEYLDGFSPDKLRKKINELAGVDEEVINDMETIKKIREARAEMQQAQMQLEQMQVASDIGMKNAQAQSMIEGALSGRPRG